uniref:Dickkopf N-terminal cysteine-rich domain-containing protein n=1 Tax=Leptobrachium leishanense TaxID=445787 RepID=A0A8C5WDU3_9ANUR
MGSVIHGQITSRCLDLRPNLTTKPKHLQRLRVCKSEGHIWAWMLSMPYNKPEDAAGLTRTAPLKGSTATCDHDRACGRGLFCDRHFGLCMTLRHEWQLCRKDSQCVRGLGCMYGRCQHIIPGGLEGSRCQQDEDCAPSMCCARHHGEMICKPKLPAGESCFIPDGGLAFSINQLCPCQEGLVCGFDLPQREKAFVYSHSSDWKCSAPAV